MCHFLTEVSPLLFLPFSFAAALDDKPIHVPRVQLHGNIHFWNYDRPEQERKGSFLVLPLEDIRRRVFGILGLDTLRDQNDQTIFVPHEIRFYQVGAAEKPQGDIRGLWVGTSQVNIGLFVVA